MLLNTILVIIVIFLICCSSCCCCCCYTELFFFVFTKLCKVSFFVMDPFWIPLPLLLCEQGGRVVTRACTCVNDNFSLLVCVFYSRTCLYPFSYVKFLHAKMNLCVQGEKKMYTAINISTCYFETCVVPVLLRYPLTYPKYFQTTEMHYWLEDLLLSRFSFWIGLSLCAFRNSVVRVYFLFCMKLWALHERVEADPATCRREGERERSWDRRSLKKK